MHGIAETIAKTKNSTEVVLDHTKSKLNEAQELKCDLVSPPKKDEWVFERCVKILSPLSYLERKQLFERLAKTFLAELTEGQTVAQLEESHPEIHPELLELLKNHPSIVALLTPPTELEKKLGKQVEEMVTGVRIAPAKYPRERSREKPLPDVFLRQHYGEYLDAGCLFSDQLRKIDEGLVQAVENFVKKIPKDRTGKAVPVSKYLPREKEKADKYSTNMPEYLRKRITYVGNILSVRERMGLC